MTTRAAIVSPWVATADGTMSNPNRPLFEDEYTYVRYEDITGQLTSNIVPQPNEYTLLVEVRDDVFAVLEADADYEVLWSEVIT